ncbi:hypothetical protein DH2020_006444 [Rehmannia glutinosa]|uniref:CONSTANS-like protein n=1 Tax=Rehmannia glutinosa TaxID=99300 RepID=A0ABR0XIW0_REHGL
MGIIQEGGGAARAKFFPAGFNVAAKPCDYCKSTAALLFCRADSAFMCIACDAKAHNVNSKHERVWMCEVCEHAPAAVTCKADAAALCVTCDRDIHSANPLASRHERVPVVPFYDTAESVVMKSAAASVLAPAVSGCDTNLFAAPPTHHDRKVEAISIEEDEYMPDSWISMSPIIAPKLPAETPDLKSMELLFQDSDQFLDFENYQILSQPYSDSVVPVQTTIKPPVPTQLTYDHTENRFEIDFSGSNINSYNSYTTPSLNHSVSSSSMDVGVVPDGNSLSEISYPFARSINSSVDLSGNQGSQILGLDREARVLRYKEKRKNRKFEKTIRYASRKAYAETRPRIKGRFAKRTDADQSDIDRIFAGSAHFIADARFGVVPSF